MCARLSEFVYSETKFKQKYFFFFFFLGGGGGGGGRAGWGRGGCVLD